MMTTTASRFSPSPIETTTYAGRRLVIAENSALRRIIRSEMCGGLSWNVEGFIGLLDAAMAPNSVLIADLTLKASQYHWTRLSLTSVLKLGGWEDLLRALQGRGTLRIHYRYDVGLNTTELLKFDCGGESMINLITGGVWHDLFQIHHPHINLYPNAWSLQEFVSSIDADWASMLMAVGGLPEPIHRRREMPLEPLIKPGFVCPYDQIVTVDDHYGSMGGGSVWATTYDTVRVSDEKPQD